MCSITEKSNVDRICNINFSIRICSSIVQALRGDRRRSSIGLFSLTVWNTILVKINRLTSPSATSIFTHTLFKRFFLLTNVFIYSFKTGLSKSRSHVISLITGLQARALSAVKWQISAGLWVTLRLRYALDPLGKLYSRYTCSRVSPNRPKSEDTIWFSVHN